MKKSTTIARKYVVLFSLNRSAATFSHGLLGSGDCISDSLEEWLTSGILDKIVLELL